MQYSPLLTDIIRAKAAEGLHASAIAREVRVHKTTVIRIAERAGIVLPHGRKGPGPNNGKRHIVVPAWVPRHLQHEYRSIGKIFGEEHAASVVRAMKRSEQP